MASGPQVRVASAAQTRVDDGLFGFTMTLPMVPPHATSAAIGRSIAEDNPGALPQTPSGAKGRMGLGPERLQHANQAGLLRSEP